MIQAKYIIEIPISEKRYFKLSPLKTGLLILKGSLYYIYIYITSYRYIYVVTKFLKLD